MGYPPRYEPSYEQVKLANKEVADELKDVYIKQMKAT